MAAAETSEFDETVAATSRFFYSDFEAAAKKLKRKLQLFFLENYFLLPQSTNRYKGFGCNKCLENFLLSSTPATILCLLYTECGSGGSYPIWARICTG